MKTDWTPKCSPSLALSVASLLVLISVAHFFFSPLAPTSLDYFSARQAQSSSAPVNGSSQLGGSGGKLAAEPEAGPGLLDRFPADSLGAVRYRGAPWKAEVGRWLAGCDAGSAPVDVPEVVSGKKCKDDCNGNGICNRELGQCRCFHGFAGEGCTENLKLECNLPVSPNHPYGPWIVSICPAYCDTTRAMCFCGEGTAYPNRPVAEGCGFDTFFPSESAAYKETNFSKADPDVFTTNTSRRGWCNVDPKEAYASKVKYKEECHCKYDCVTGTFCEQPTLCSCINQCSGHGFCRGGFCQCDSGWYGIDCSVPSVLSPIQEWPIWLRPSTINLPKKLQESTSSGNVKALVEKKRPLIYVYDLPPEFNSHLLEGRHFKAECVNRLYTEQNRTAWIDQLYGSQLALYESMLASPHRTLNGEEADYFYVPVLDSCIFTRADDAPHFYMTKPKYLRSFMTFDIYKKAYGHIAENYPYWNRSSGKDHIWLFAWDEGACCAPKEIWNSMMLVHWGNTNSKHNRSTTAYLADKWDMIPVKNRGKHPCFDPEKDLVIPSWKSPDPDALSLNLWNRSQMERKTLFYFNGNLGPAYANGRPEFTYSMGIRQKIALEFGSVPDKNGKLGKQHAKDVIVTPHRSPRYYDELASSLFCGVFPGDGWSGRMEDSILQGCIPVVIQDGIFLPYENVLNYKSFAVRIHEDDIPNMINILRNITKIEIESMLANVKSIWQRFLYRDSMLLEAERQKMLFGQMESWAVEFHKLGEDDVFSTVLQVLHYKLHNDPWRKHLHSQQKNSGLPKVCLSKSS